MPNSNLKPLSVEGFYTSWKDELGIDLLPNSKGLERIISSQKVQKPGLRMIDKNIPLEEGKIQILGSTEVSYLDNLSKQEQKRIATLISEQNVPCFIFSKGIVPNKYFTNELIKKGIPLFSTNSGTEKLISSINNILSLRLAPFTTMHGVLIDIHSMGVLITGRSGIGKSECALDLITKGSKLVADDVVEIRKIDQNTLLGSGPNNIKYLMEIRGVGIVNIKDLFGPASVMDEREIDMVIELNRWDQDVEYDRLGIEIKTFNIIEIEVPYVVIPVSPGRNVSSIIEVAVRNQILKSAGLDDRSALKKDLNIS